MLSFDNVTKTYNSHSVALEGVTFKVRNGEFVSIVGQSGAGKTTLLKLLIAEEKPTAGKIFFETTDVHSLPLSELPNLRRRIGMIFQDFKLLPKKTAYENVAFAMEVVGKSQKEISDDVPQVLELVGLSEKMSNFPHQLSGGEKQRVAIARAFVHRPDIIIADEPTGNLDPINTWDIIRLLLRINELGTTVVLASHDREVINSVNKRVVTLDKGKLVRDEENGRYII